MDFSAELQDSPVNASLSVGSRLPLSHQEKAIVELHETINQLATRLKPVLTPAHEVQDGDGSTTAEAKDLCSPLTDQLGANNRGISKASRNIRALIERIEC